MKIKFWKKEEEETPELKDDLTKDFGGPGLSEPAELEHPLAREAEIRPRFDEYSGTSKPSFQEPARTYSKEDLLEAKMDAIKSKIEIIDHKLDLIISRLKDAY